MQATHNRRHERVGWRKKRRLYFPLPHTCSLRWPHKMESLLACCFYKVSYKTAVGSLKASIRTQITTYLCINFYGLTWERILPTLGALRDDTKMAERETSIPCTSQPHNSESRPQIRKIPDPGSRKTYWEPRYSRTCNAEKVIVSRGSLRTSSPWPFGGVAIASPSRLASFPTEMESLLVAFPRSWGRLSKLPNEGGVLRDSCTCRLRLKLSLRLRQH